MRWPFRPVSSTTWNTQTRRPLPCSPLADPKPGPLLLRPHSPTTAFHARRIAPALLPPGRPCRAPVTTPAAAVVPVLVLIFSQSVTSLEGVIPRARCRMSGLPARHSFHECGNDVRVALTISGGRTQKLPLTHRQEAFAFRHRLRMRSLARAFAPFMVELFAPPDLLEYPSLVIGPAPAVTSRRLPTAAHVERTSRARTPQEDLRSNDRSPALSTTALAKDKSPVHQSLSASPPLRGHKEKTIGSNAEITRLAYKTSRITSASLRRTQQAILMALRSTGTARDGR